MSTETTTEDQHDTDLRTQLAAAVQAGDHDNARRLRDELTDVDLRRRGRTIAATLPPPNPETIQRVADLFGCVVTEGSTER